MWEKKFQLTWWNSIYLDSSVSIFPNPTPCITHPVIQFFLRRLFSYISQKPPSGVHRKKKSKKNNEFSCFFDFDFLSCLKLWHSFMIIHRIFEYSARTFQSLPCTRSIKIDSRPSSIFSGFIARLHFQLQTT